MTPMLRAMVGSIVSAAAVMVVLLAIFRHGWWIGVVGAFTFGAGLSVLRMRQTGLRLRDWAIMRWVRKEVAGKP
jgi:hypothetical protein